MVSVEETIFRWVPVPYLTMVVLAQLVFFYLPTDNSQAGMLVGR